MNHKVFAVAVGLMSLLVGCCPHASADGCRADDLLLEPSDFPGNIWEEVGARGPRDAPSRLGIERAGTSFSTPEDGGAVQDFYRFATEADARVNYEKLQVDWFNLNPQGSIEFLPQELASMRLGADEYRMGCARSVIESCGVVARYGTRVVEFVADLPALTYADFAGLVGQIDKKMLACTER